MKKQFVFESEYVAKILVSYLVSIKEMGNTDNVNARVEYYKDNDDKQTIRFVLEILPAAPAVEEAEVVP